MKQNIKQEDLKLDSYGKIPIVLNRWELGKMIYGHDKGHYELRKSLNKGGITELERAKIIELLNTLIKFFNAN